MTMPGNSVAEATLDPMVQMGILFAVGTLAAFFFHKLRLPTLLGFILTGVILGPSALGWIHQHDMEVLSHVGILFLLFLVGLELSWTKIKQLRFQAPLAGFLQLTFSGILVAAAMHWITGMPLQLAFLMGSILSLSSTAVVLKTMEDQRQLDTLHGRIILAVLIIQDLAIIPLMTLLASMSQPVSGAVLGPILWALIKALLVTALVVGLSLRILPRILDRLASTNRKEIFLLTVISLVMGFSWLCQQIGISSEAGALIAGISLSGSIFAHQVFVDSRSYRDIFVMIFFVTLGLWVDLNFMAAHWQAVLACTLGLFVLKGLAGFLAVRLSGFHVKNAWWTAVALFQAGEFSFVALSHMLQVLAPVQAWAGWLATWGPLLTNTIVCSMFLTPLVLRAASHSLHRFNGGASASLTGGEGAAHAHHKGAVQPQVIVGGYGPSARYLVDALKNLGISYCIVEMNSQTVKDLQQAGEPCLFGDLSNPTILSEAGIDNATTLAVTFPDLQAAESCIHQARQLKPDIRIMVRALYRVNIERLARAGANEVVCSESETGLRLVDAWMRAQSYSELEVGLMSETLRHNDLQYCMEMMGDSAASCELAFGQARLPGLIRIEWLPVAKDSALLGQSLDSVRLRQRTGVTILSIVSGAGNEHHPPDPNYQLAEGDILVVIGNLEQLRALTQLLATPVAPPPPTQSAA